MRASSTFPSAFRRSLGAKRLVVGLLVALTFLVAPPQKQAHAEHSAADVPEAGTYVHLQFTSSLGDSLRFNNPFRLAHQLGDTGESLSLTPPYANLGGAAALGDPDGWQFGLSLQWSRELGGVRQHVLAPGSLITYGGARPWVPFARLAVPVIVNPDPGAGLEASAGIGYLLTAGIGVQGEIVGDVFYGAATWEKPITTIPMLSIQAGLFVDYEVLP